MSLKDAFLNSLLNLNFPVFFPIFLKNIFKKLRLELFARSKNETKQTNKLEKNHKKNSMWKPDIIIMSK